jgi:hypothetical protein
VKSDLEYQLQACRNLEAEMLALGWPTDAAHFRLRIKQLNSSLGGLDAQLRAVSAALPKQIGRALLNAGIARGRLISIRETLITPSPIQPLTSTGRAGRNSRQNTASFLSGSSINRKSAIENRK